MTTTTTKTIGPNPTLIRLDVPRGRQQRVGEDRRDYLRYAASVARRALRRLLAMDDYRYCHRSFAVRDALLLAEAACPDLGTFGVEGIQQGHNRRSPAIDYLNAGDTYTTTLMYVRGDLWWATGGALWSVARTTETKKRWQPTTNTNETRGSKER